ncbi:MAG: phosphoribosylanthranilate isomerase [Lachnospiraceae bacterium]|nr:phosphoribosylanthranilate isomerase [Lachnospiraceae bacterium]
MSKIKICGLFRECDIEYVNEAMPDYAGFIIDFPKSHRNLSPTDVGELRKKLNPKIKAVGVFVNRSVEFVCSTAKDAELDVIQLHGEEDNLYIRRLRERLSQEFLNPPVIWKAFKIKSKKDLDVAEGSSADEILLDNGYGTGKAFDWSVLENSIRPFILAGGLTPEKIKDAVKKYEPECVDVSSGVESDRKKDREKILLAVRNVRQKII